MPDRFLFLIFVAVPPRSRHRPRRKMVLVERHACGLLHDARLRRREVRPRPAGPAEEPWWRRQARSRVTVGAGEHGGEAGAVMVFRRRRRLGLVTSSLEIVLHLEKLHLLASLDLFQLLHLELEAALLVTEAFVFSLFLFQQLHLGVAVRVFILARVGPSHGAA